MPTVACTPATGTNVLITGLRSKHGASNAFLQLLNDPRLKLHVSNALLFEYEAKPSN